MGSLEQAVRTASSGLTPDGKRHPHQRRVPRKALATACRLLLPVTAEVWVCASFDKLLALVTAKTHTITGFGVLAQYDTALRIGAFLSLSPSDLLYILEGDVPPESADANGSKFGGESSAYQPHSLER